MRRIAVTLSCAACLATSFRASAIDTAEAIALSQARDAQLATMAFSVHRTDLGQSALWSDSAHWIVVLAPDKYEFSFTHSGGEGDAPDLADMESVSFGTLDGYVWWSPELGHAQVHVYDQPLVDRMRLPWQSSLPYLFLFPPAPTAPAQLGLTSLLQEPGAELEALDAGFPNATHMLYAPEVNGGHSDITVWVDFSQGAATVSRYRSLGRELRATEFLTVGGVRVPRSVTFASVDAWNHFDATGRFPDDGDILRFDLGTLPSGEPDFVIGSAASQRFHLSLDTLPAGTTVYEDERAPSVIAAAGSSAAPATTTVTAVGAVEPGHGSADGHLRNATRGWASLAAAILLGCGCAFVASKTLTRVARGG
ncbi:MAG: hypothetical protein JNM94_06420 [Phycisphaerae bacterium]|nr:hypothetical protein [Phycisphaerae bacterium]